MVSATSSASIRGKNTSAPEDSVILTLACINLYPFHTFIQYNNELEYIVKSPKLSWGEVQMPPHQRTAVFEDADVMLSSHTWPTR